MTISGPLPTPCVHGTRAHCARTLAIVLTRSTPRAIAQGRPLCDSAAMEAEDDLKDDLTRLVRDVPVKVAPASTRALGGIHAYR